MNQLSLQNGTLIVLSGILALGTVACGSNNPVILKSEAANALPSSPASTPLPKPLPSALIKAPTAPNLYEQAVDIATGATHLSESALVREDWNLVANRWQEAIRLLRTVPASNKRYAVAQKKLKEYQNHLAQAKAKAAPPPPKSCSNDTNPEFFFAPIKRRVAGIPVIEVTFPNDQKFDMLVDTGASNTLVTQSMAATLQLPIVGIEVGSIADGSSMTLPTALLKFAEIDGRMMRNIPVAIAPSTMEFGLLGQDFFKSYDLTITDSVIEFHRQPGVKTRTRGTLSPKSCRVDTEPEFFSVPIKRREQGLPVVEVTFNDRYRFDMVFDTGATTTIVSRSMAAQLELPLVGTRRVKIANGSVVALPTALIESQKINSRTRTDLVVSVAPPALGMGLLGHDFFEGYNVTIKKNAIEFRRQRYRS